ncbi:MAG: hypothetical protein JNK89_00300 [Saprospiraceae bacterium]|nr:hypothetical protein [Saprospiraceae bacterium]
MANHNTSKFWTWLLIAIGFAALLILVGYFFFPELIAKLTSMVVGLLLVVTGLVFRRKK